MSCEHIWERAEIRGSRNGLPDNEVYYKCQICKDRRVNPFSDCSCISNSNYCAKHRAPEDYGFRSSLD